MPFMPSPPVRSPTCLFLLATASLGCADLIGLGQYDTGGAAGAATAGTAGTGGTSAGGTGGTSAGGTGGTSAGGTGGAGTGGTGGASTGGTGGTSTGGAGGAGGATECVPNSKEACYSGPPDTVGIGACEAGQRTCDGNGVWGTCLGEVVPKLENCGNQLVDENCDQIAKCTGQYRWARRFGGPGLQVPTAVAADPDGNVVFVGYADAPFEMGGAMLDFVGAEDLFVAKLDSAGKHVWSKMRGDVSNQRAAAVAVDAQGNIVVAGQFAGKIDFGSGPIEATDVQDILVVKLDPDGNQLWAQVMGGTNADLANAVAIDEAGDVYVIGAYRGAPVIGLDTPPASVDGSYNILVAKLSSATGAPIWAKGFGEIYDQVGQAIAVGGGFVYLAANASGPLTFDGTTYLGEGGNGDIAVAKLAADTGLAVWGKRYGDIAVQQAIGIALAATPAGVVIAGQVRGTINFGSGNFVGDAALDVAVWKLGLDGALIWSKRAGAAATDQYVFGLAVDPAGYPLVAGSFESTLDFTSNMSGLLTATTTFDRFFTRLGPGGGHFWSRSYPNGTGAPTKLAVDRIGRIDFVSLLYGETDFGGGTLASSSAADGDIVVGQLAP
jgi:hypothetical protein